MEARIYKGQANIYNTETHEITTTRNWRDTFTEIEVIDWMNGRRDSLIKFNEYDDVKWRLWEDGCYRMTAYRYAKKSQKGRPLKPMAVCYIFRPVQE